MSDEWEYCGGELAWHGMTVRQYRKGPIGRTHRTLCHYGEHHGEAKVRYFVWDAPRNSPEYETEEQALEALA